MGHLFCLKIARRNFAVQIKKGEGTLEGGGDRNLELIIFVLANSSFGIARFLFYRFSNSKPPDYS